MITLPILQVYVHGRQYAHETPIKQPKTNNHLLKLLYTFLGKFKYFAELESLMIDAVRGNIGRESSSKILGSLLKSSLLIIPLIIMLFSSCFAQAEDMDLPDIRNDATEYTIAANLKANNTPAWSNNEEDFNFSNRGLSRPMIH